VLQEFLSSNRNALIDRCRTMVASRSGPKLPSPETAHGIPLFIDQIIKTLAVEQIPDSSHATLEPNNGRDHSLSEVGATATLHGRDLLDEGFTLEQVIRDYGDVCQAVTSLASETGAPISAGEFHIFNRCLDDAIAAAVTEYSLRKSKESADAAAASSPSAPGSNDLDHLESALTQTQLALAFTEAALTAAQLEAHAAHARSLHDSLTGLPNRELFDDRLTKAISLANRHAWTLAVMFLDLDDFKNINDVHGHAVGDAVLRKIAERLRERVRQEDTVCRNGGDEFLYLLMNPGGQENLERIAHSMSSGIAQPVAVGEFEFTVKLSIGIAIYPGDGYSGKDLIANADAAMYRAKRHPRGVVLFAQQGAEAPDTL
jgi:diguanylate cyclase (GGDEF)-like protein